MLIYSLILFFTILLFYQIFLGNFKEGLDDTDNSNDPLILGKLNRADIISMKGNINKLTEDVTGLMAAQTAMGTDISTKTDLSGIIEEEEKTNEEEDITKINTTNIPGL